jgi:hypothetical protein
MSGRANATDAAGDLGHLLNGPTDAKHLKPAQLRDLQISMFHVALAIEKNVDFAMAFEASNGIDSDMASGGVRRRN